MYKYLLGFAFTASLLTSCLTDTEHIRARNLHYTIRQVNDSFFSQEKEWSKVMSYAVSTGNYSDLRPLRKSLEANLDSGFDRIDRLPDGGGSQPYHKAELDLLRFEKEVVREHMLPFEKYHYNTPVSVVSESVAQLKVAASREKLLIDKVAERADSFAEENRLKFASGN